MDFKKCASCESENPETEVYCLECGSKLEPEKAPRKAPSQVAGALAEAEALPQEAPFAPEKKAAAAEPVVPQKPAQPPASVPPAPAVPVEEAAPGPEAPAEAVQPAAPAQAARPPASPPEPAARYGTGQAQAEAAPDKKPQKLGSQSVPSKFVRAALIAGGVFILAAVVWRLGFRPERQAAPEAAPRVVKISVTPFAAATGQAEAGYFGEGLAEALADGLNDLPGLRLMVAADPASSSGSGGAGFALSGTFDLADGRLRVSALLVRTADGSEAWASRFEGASGETFALLRDIALALVRAVGSNIPGGSVDGAFDAGPRSAEACDLYFQGRWRTRRGGKANLEKAVELFEQAAAKDSGWAEAFAGQAKACLALGCESLWSPERAFPPARKAVIKALDIDPGLAEARLALAQLKWRSEWDFAAAEREFREALRLAPGQTEVRRSFALFLSSLGRHEEAQSMIAAALALDNRSPRLGTALGLVLYFARLYDQAEAELSRALETWPGDFEPCLDLGLLHIQTRDFAQSLGMFQRAAALGADPMETGLRAGIVLAHAGRRPDVGKILESAFQASRSTYVSSASIAAVYGALLEPDQAQVCLEKALAERDASLVFLKVSPLFDSVRSEDWFPALLRKAGF